MVDEWHNASAHSGIDLTKAIGELLTPSTTYSLPAEWQGEYPEERARRWITERDAESTTLLVVDRSTNQPLGLMLLFFDDRLDGSTSGDVRLGYVFRESAWGQGLGTELVSGLVAWAHTQPNIARLVAGVDPSHEASVRILIKNGFGRVDAGSSHAETYQLDLLPRDPWDEYAAGWDDDPAARRYADEAHTSLTSLLTGLGKSVTGMTICDFGCGTGLLTERLVNAAEAIDAVDTSAAMLAVLTSKIEQRGWTNVRASLELPDSIGTYNLVVCSSVLGFVDDYPATVARLGELLKPSGLLVQWDWERDDTGADDDTHGLSRNEVRAALNSAGLNVLRVETAFEITFDQQTMAPLIGVGQRGTKKTGGSDTQSSAAPVISTPGDL